MMMRPPLSELGLVKKEYLPIYPKPEVVAEIAPADCFLTLRMKSDKKIFSIISSYKFSKFLCSTTVIFLYYRPMAPVLKTVSGDSPS